MKIEKMEKKRFHDFEQFLEKADRHFRFVTWSSLESARLTCFSPVLKPSPPGNKGSPPQPVKDMEKKFWPLEGLKGKY